MVAVAGEHFLTVVTAGGFGVAVAEADALSAIGTVKPARAAMATPDATVRTFTFPSPLSRD
jgi:hypothetical protein